MNLTPAMRALTSVAAGCPALLWSDEFNGVGGGLNESHWTPQTGDGCPGLCGWGNAEAQWYTGESNSNFAVVDGALEITARQEAVGSKLYSSARLRSLNKVDIDLSSSSTDSTRIEARIKVPDAGLGIWPAFWLMPTPEAVWPTGGEIDVMEYIGREPWLAQGYAHYGEAYGYKSQRGGPLKLSQPVADDYHVFAIDKTANRITWSVDGHAYQSYTKNDIEPAYTWPFDGNTYHMILNVAVGGNWPGYPNEQQTKFPSTMKVDYVRVYDISQGSFGNIIGPRLVQVNDNTAIYCVEGVGSAGISWSLPSGATIVQEMDECITVSFAEVISGDITATMDNSACSNGAAAAQQQWTWTIPVEVQGLYQRDFTILNATTILDSATGSYAAVVDDDEDTNNKSVMEYNRSITELYDSFWVNNFVINNLDDYTKYANPTQKFYIELKSTTAAPCTRVIVQLEDSATTLPTNYPVGRHSRYQCFMEPTADWQRLACDFKDRPDASVVTVDRVTVLIDSFVHRGDTYWIRSLDSASLGCDSSSSNAGSCEALPINGPSTTNCRKAAKSEAGACTDGVNNDKEGYNGNFPTDCDDPQCYMLDPACDGGGDGGGDSTPTPTVETTTSSPGGGGDESTPAPTVEETNSPTTSSPSLDNTSSPSPAPVQSTPMPSPPDACPDNDDGQCDSDPDNPVKCGGPPDYPCLYKSACLADEAGFDPETECCQAPPRGVCTTEFNPKICGSMMCPFTNQCIAELAGYTADQCVPDTSPSPTPPDEPATTSSPTPPPEESPTTTPMEIPEWAGAPECSLNSQCVGLADDCCPTQDDVFLYCCYESTPTSGYEKEFTFVGPRSGNEQASYFSSTAPYYDPDTDPDGVSPVVSYVRNGTEQFDLIYYKTSAIPDAALYVNNGKRMYMDVYSSAPQCTQIMVQFDSLPLANSTNFPIGRHSRYHAFTTTNFEWERLEFMPLDRPDPQLSDSSVNSIALFFEPGSFSADQYYFRNFDSAISGCVENNCEETSPKSCQAMYSGEEGSCDDGADNDGDMLIDCEDPDCTADAACTQSMALSFAAVESNRVQSSAMMSSHSGLTVVASFVSLLPFLFHY